MGSSKTVRFATKETSKPSLSIHKDFLTLYIDLYGAIEYQQLEARELIGFIETSRHVLTEEELDLWLDHFLVLR